jgi:proline utilization trans-activator
MRLRGRIARLEKRDAADGQESSLLPRNINGNTQSGQEGDGVVGINDDNEGGSQPGSPSRESAARDEPQSPAMAANQEEAGMTGMSNPLASEKSAYMPDTTGRLRYLGHSSTWSFSRQLLNMAYQRTHSSPLPEASMHVEGEAYDLGWNGFRVSTPPDIGGLPSLDFSLYLIQTVKFRVCQLLHLFDEESFMSNLDQFYKNPSGHVNTARLWYIHFLVILAFGKAFVGQNRVVNCPPGSELFVRAMTLLPDVTLLCLDPILSTEVLSCIALYLQAIDHRSAAHIYASVENRLCIQRSDKAIDWSSTANC